MTIQSYLDTLNLRYKTGTYSGALQTLFISIIHDILMTNKHLIPRSRAQYSPEFVAEFSPAYSFK